MKEQTDKVKPLYSLAEITKYFLKLGTWGFGGPVALVGYMQRDLVFRSMLWRLINVVFRHQKL